MSFNAVIEPPAPLFSAHPSHLVLPTLPTYDPRRTGPPSGVTPTSVPLFL